ncbi:MAG TPA: glycosyltransferase family 2 protein [Frateuria sp.]|uniref:glycosyltransferase family 2 protein n=1 Tax=Frateuria sp. TaxID=2211372 RepID=UPI002DE3D877|nr:glycosyltransferase family 2 protein [Frateuria sp.]
MMTVAYLVFVACALGLAHVFVGYPLWVAALARWWPRRVRSQAWAPRVTAVVAVHDGASHIEAKLAGLLALDYPRGLLDVVVACDGCTDDTAARCRRLGDERIRVLEFDVRRGKAACLNDAVAQARGEVLLMTDVRQRLEPDALLRLVANLGDPAVGAVSGELRLFDAQTGFARGIDAYWRYEKLIRRAESRSGSVVGVSGALYAIRRELFRPLPPGTVLDDVLVPMQVAAAGRRVVFEPQAVAWDGTSQQPQEEQRRKIRTLAGNYQLVQLAPWLLLPWRNPLWFRFVSHKLLRLLAPWLLLGLALAAALLATRHTLFAAITLALAAALAAVIVGRHLPSLGGRLPVRLLTAFCYLNLFAAQALVAFARNRRLHLW